MKKNISLFAAVVVLTAMLVSPMSASANYQIIGSAVVNDNTAANEVIFGDTFVNSSAVNADGHPLKLTYTSTPSSPHGLNWNRGVKPASTATYLGEWRYASKDNSTSDYYLRMETGSETTSKNANHILYIAPGADVFVGNGSDASGVYIIECDILPGTSKNVAIKFPKSYLYANSAFSAVSISGTDGAIKFSPYEWHHVIAVIDEVNQKYYGFIDGELVKDDTFDAKGDRSKGTQLRIEADLRENAYCGIDNFVVRKAGNRQLVFDGVLYNDVKTNATYSNKSAAISSDAQSIFLNKLIINESSEDKEYYIMGATYVNNELDKVTYKQVKATGSDYGEEPEVITVKAHGYCHYAKSFENIDPNTEKAKLFIWEKDNNTPVTVNDEFIKSTN